MAKFKETVNELRSKVNGKGYKRSDLVTMTQTLLNDPDYTFNKVKNNGGVPEDVQVQPSKKFREALQPTLRSIGLDKNEAAEAAAKLQFSKDAADAIVEMNDCVLKEYLDMGRKYKLPMTSDKETQMGIVLDTAPEKIAEAKRPGVDPVTGKGTQIPTGKTTKTKERTVIKAKNTVPAWLKEDI